MPVGQLMAVRGVFAVALHPGPPAPARPAHRPAGAVHLAARRRRGRGHLRLPAALARLPIGDTYTLYFAGPLLLTAGAALLLGERVGPRRWAAVTVGFLGVLVVLGLPRDWQAASLIALAAALLSVARDLTTRWIPASVGSGTVAALTGVASRPRAGPPPSAATGSRSAGTMSACARSPPWASPAATPAS